MKTILFGTTILGIALAVGCSTQSKPIIDPNGVDMGLYQHDLAECEQIAQQVDQKAGAGAAGGALLGGILGAIVGDSDTALRGAGVGGVTGGVKGATQTQQEKDVVVKNCLRHRGYQVLN